MDVGELRKKLRKKVNWFRIEFWKFSWLRLFWVKKSLCMGFR